MNLPLPQGTHPETGLYHVDYMPVTDDPVLGPVRRKQLAGEPLSIAEGMMAGRDTTVTELDGVPLRPDYVYRAVGHDALASYLDAGSVISRGEGDEPGEGHNKGIDWYLGGVALRYGDVVLEAPADPEYFVPAAKEGHALAKNPMVRHMKSSGSFNPLPMDQVTILRTSNSLPREK